ncbi:hypothetical protein [Streptosporangium sp. CA-115845]|uniref:hypothetical protein n=1 Tax=Streptosporangium sp. CA-115845 TaxID=3240071 RepID=UPI003D8FFD65
MSKTRKAVAVVAAFLAVGVGSLITAGPAAALPVGECPYGFEWCQNGDPTGGDPDGGVFGDTNVPPLGSGGNG